MLRDRKVAILLATKNSSRFLELQLDSIKDQSFTNWVVYVSDDGSTDDTLRIVRSYQEQWGDRKIKIYTGPKKGYGNNFFSLIRRRNIQADYYAFCDHDDIWKIHKIERALKILSELSDKIPLLYASSSEYIDESNKVIGSSKLFQNKPSFKNALVQNICAGNTMIMNNNTRSLLLSLPDELNILSHDWTTYLLVSALKGYVHYDPYAGLLYRQHTSNLLGGNRFFSSKLHRILLLTNGYYKDHIDANFCTLQAVRDSLDCETLQILDAFAELRSRPFYSKVAAFRKLGVSRQSSVENCALHFALLLNRL